MKYNFSYVMVVFSLLVMSSATMYGMNGDFGSYSSSNNRRSSRSSQEDELVRLVKERGMYWAHEELFRTLEKIFHEWEEFLVSGNCLASQELLLTGESKDQYPFLHMYVYEPIMDLFAQAKVDPAPIVIRMNTGNACNLFLNKRYIMVNLELLALCFFYDEPMNYFLPMMAHQIGHIIEQDFKEIVCKRPECHHKNQSFNCSNYEQEGRADNFAIHQLHQNKNYLVNILQLSSLYDYMKDILLSYVTFYRCDYGFKEGQYLFCKTFLYAFLSAQLKTNDFAKLREFNFHEMILPIALKIERSLIKKLGGPSVTTIFHYHSRGKDLPEKHHRNRRSPATNSKEKVFLIVYESLVELLDSKRITFELLDKLREKSAEIFDEKYFLFSRNTPYNIRTHKCLALRIKNLQD